MKASHLLTRCPVCSGRVAVSELKCESCEVTVRGRFEIPVLCQLPKELYEFLLVFVRNRGVIRDVERELGISYPTVRSRLDAVLAALGTAWPVMDAHQQVIDMLERGEITPEEAERMLRREPGEDGGKDE